MDRFEIQWSSPERRRCTAWVGAGVLDRLADELSRGFGDRRAFLISDSNVAPLYAAPLEKRLRASGIAAELIGFPAGETHKVRRTKAYLEDRLLELGAGRDALIVSVGGGVTGDLAGFLAATWHRGVPLVQVPTTLLAMVDASIGGKSAVNLPGGKNLVGAFHQPVAVWADVDTLATLPDEVYRDGFAEMIKAAAIADADLFARLERAVSELLSRSSDALIDLIGRCARVKAEIVSGDERESGPRAMLNFGHTVAHALEAASGYELRHGPAVAIGMCVEAELGRALLGFPEQDLLRLRALIDALGLPTVVPAGTDLDALIEAAGRDKKVRRERLRFALPCGLGKMPAAEDVCVESESAALLEALRSSG